MLQLKKSMLKYLWIVVLTTLVIVAMTVAGCDNGAKPSINAKHVVVTHS